MLILHARTEYQDCDEPQKKRHLLRLWLTNPALKDGDVQIRQGIRRARLADVAMRISNGYETRRIRVAVDLTDVPCAAFLHRV